MNIPYTVKLLGHLREQIIKDMFEDWEPSEARDQLVAKYVLAAAMLQPALMTLSVSIDGDNR